MDFNNDHNVDALLKKALKNPVKPKPDPELLNKVKSGLKIKEDDEEMSKPTMKRNFGKIAAIVAVATLTITTTALAAGVYLGSFDRLREVVGDERADVLQPIEIGVGYYSSNGANDSNEIYESGVSETTSAESNTNEIRINESNAAEHGIRAELVAVGVYDNVVDVYVTLEDLIGNRLDGEFQASHFLTRAVDAEVGTISTPPEIINRTDDGVVTIRSREMFPYSVAGLELTYIFTGIAYNFSEYPRPRSEMVELDFDLSEAGDSPTMLLTTRTGGGGGGGMRDIGAILDAIWEQIRTVGLPILETRLHDITFSVNSSETTLSSIGIVDGNLRIQQALNRSEEEGGVSGGVSHFILVDSQGDWVDRVGISFSVDSYGNPIDFDYEGPISLYSENIFFIDDLSRLSEYSLYVIYSPRFTFDRIPLYWSVNFQVESNDAQVIASDLNIQYQDIYQDITITEIRVSPFLIHVQVETEQGYLPITPLQVAVRTKNGIVEAVQSSGIREHGNSSSRYVTNIFYDVSTALDLDGIISIEIAGEIVTFS